MNIDLQQKLWDEFPLLYEEIEGSTVRRVYFEVNDGWFDLIHELSTKLYPLVKDFNIQYKDTFIPLKFSVSQVKEKYGSLRFYADLTTNEMNILIEEAEKRSKKICEVCGKPGEIRRGHWVNTLCDEHNIGDD